MSTGAGAEPSDGAHDAGDPSTAGLLGADGSQAEGLLSADGSQTEGLLSRLEVIDSQPIGQRAAGFDQLAEELLSELQRSDHEGEQ
ncbi:hypothetical protein ACFPZL_09405 [Leucobacter soli]|uniref:hypothetical protein n=1 Tax=Leucobacter soli TaxID=2812850 RepID=UPI003619703D